VFDNLFGTIVSPIIDSVSRGKGAEGVIVLLR
jgi:hypothetical protein